MTPLRRLVAVALIPLLLCVNALAVDLIPPKIASESYVLMEYETGEILAEQNPDLPLPPASLAKIMTALIGFEAVKNNMLHYDEMVPVSRKAWKSTGSRMFIDPATPVSIFDLLSGIIIQSGNDASIALAEAVAGDEETFTELMNRKAKEIGLENTLFSNSSGFPTKSPQRTSAADMAHLARYVIRHHPEDYRLYAEESFTYNDIAQPNRNKLLARYPGADGIKTGYTKNAGYSLVASAVRDNRRLIAVVMKTKSPRVREREAGKLLNYGFRAFKLHALQDIEKTNKIPIWQGDVDEIAIGIDTIEKFLTTASSIQKIQLIPRLNAESLIAPIDAGTTVGTLDILVDGADTPIRQFPIVTKEAVPAGGYTKQIVDYLKLHYLGHAHGYRLSQW